MTQEFHLSITPIRSEEYLVRTEEVAPGVPLAEEQYVWPTSEWLAQARALMNDPLMGVLQGDRLTTQDQAETSATLTTLGQQLYSHLFQGRLRDSWMTAQGIAQHRGEALRLRLGLKGHTLPGIPWEVLNGGSSEGFHASTQHLSTGVNILFSRYLADAGMGNALGYQAIPKPSKTIKILMAIAAPTDQQQLKLKQEAYHLQDELRLRANVLQAGGAHLLPDIQVTILEQPGREELAQALEQGQYHVFHYAGHSELGEAGGKIYLVNRQTGLSETLNGNDLAGLLFNNDIQMAVFNSCRGAHTASGAADGQRQIGTLTDALVSRGIPAVLAMAEQIPDDVALSLTRLFYRNLKQGYPVDLSLSRARQGLLSAYSSDQLYWALPILYLNPDFDGYLTAGDRSLENPADALIRLPHLHSSPLTEARAAVTPHQDDDEMPGDPMSQDVTDDVTDNLYASRLSTPPLPGHQNRLSSMYGVTGKHPEGDEPTPVDVSHNDVSDTNGQHPSVLEPQDAPVLGDHPELPDDFFLADNELHGLDDGLTQDFLNDEVDESESVRNLVEQLEGGASTTDAIAHDLPYSLNDDPEAAAHLLYNGQPPSDDAAEIARDISMVTSDQEGSDITPPTLEGEDDAQPSLTLLPSASDSGDDDGTELDLVDDANGLSMDHDADNSVDPVLLRQRQASPWKKLVWLPIASVAGAAVVFLGHQVLPRITDISDQSPVTPGDVNCENLVEKPTSRVADCGLASFSLDNVESGQAAIVELLDRGELDRASDVFESIPSRLRNNPNVIFLEGRLAWQYSLQNNPKYSVQDASQFWSYSAQKADESEAPLHYNALGFARYTEGDLEGAIDAWEQALMRIDEGGVNILPEDNGQAIASTSAGMTRVGVPQGQLTNQDALTAYSGIALVSMQLAAKSSVEQPYDLVNQAFQIRQIVMQSPMGIDPDTSEHAWLWTDALANQWQIFKNASPQ
jgi:tetratricopeptide (TPR) repeat protein